MPSLGKLKVLVVEDDLLFNQFYTMFLETRDAICLSCFTVAEAIQQIQSQDAESFDVIILDNHLGDGEGLSILPLIKSRCPSAAVVMVSANDDTDFFLKAFAQGIDDYVVKPINMDLLWVKITRSIAQYRLQAANARQQHALEIMMSEEKKEQELARFIFENMTRHMSNPLEFITKKIQPSALFSGDVVLHRQGFDGSWYVLLADSMGHGLAAAVGLMPMMEVFESMAIKALPLSNIVFELNRKLVKQLPDDRFVAAVILKINPMLDLIEVWNGGMPPVMIFDQQGQLITQIRSSHMALGILPDDLVEVNCQKLRLSEVENLLLISDGVIETKMKETGSFLSISEIISFYQQEQGRGFAKLLQILAETIDATDDVSACEICCGHLKQISSEQTLVLKNRPGVFVCDFKISGHCLNALNPPTELVELLLHLTVPQELCNKAFAVLTELYLNAFEHGVLKLDSAIKQQEDGFFQFYQQKEEVCSELTMADEIYIHLQWDAENSKLHLEIKDSGLGFKHSADLNSELQSYGRGLSMVAKLSNEFEVIGRGNHMKVVLNG